MSYASKSIRNGDVDLVSEELDGGGPPIVLIMGLNAQMLMWPDRLCEALADRGHRVIRYDNRDVGLSARLDHLGTPNIPAAVVRKQFGLPVRSPYTLTDMADDARAVLDAHGLDRACIVGASMGGMIAQRVAIHHAERTAGLVSIMSTPGSTKPRYRGFRALLRPPKPGREGYIESFVDTFLAIGSQTHPPPREDLQALAERLYDREPSRAGFARQFGAILAEPGREALLSQVQTPSLVIHGAQDPLIPLMYGIRTSKCLGCRLEVHPEMGHDLPPVVWERLVDSISRHATEAATQ
jgi:pimeloyl-ACP methyl ester carboxylesterase